MHQTGFLNFRRSFSKKKLKVSLFIIAIMAGPGLLLGIVTRTAFAGPIITSLVSTTASREQGNDVSDAPAVSSDGRFVAFHSAATNLGAIDHDPTLDIYLKDTDFGGLTLVSTSPAGVKGNGENSNPAISDNGRYVAFQSTSTNLIATDPDATTDIYIKDLLTGAITLVSTSTAGVKGNGISDNPAISADGRFVAFQSRATNLDIDDGDVVIDIFVKDTLTGNTSLVSRSAGCVKGGDDSINPDVSNDGRFVTFSSKATNLGDPDPLPDIYLKDMQTAAVMILSANLAGTKGNGISDHPVISADGRFIVFESASSNLDPADSDIFSDIYKKDNQTGSLTLVSTNSAGAKGNDNSVSPSMSPDTRYVAFSSASTNMDSADTNITSDIYVKDAVTGGTTLVSTGLSGISGNADSGLPGISNDGRYVAFGSQADNLTADTNGASDVFINHANRRDAFTWYDNKNARNWILAANPAGSPSDAWFDLAIAGNLKTLPPLPGFSPGQIPAGKVVFSTFGTIGGPLDMGFYSRSGAFTSQRTLWAGSSLEEVTGKDTRKLSSHFFWTWYDQASAGFANWVLVANPNADRVFYRVKVAGSELNRGVILPGGNTTLAFAGIIGGPVEVEAWFDSAGGSLPARVMASQRVLTNSRTAFNEVPGIASEELSNHYHWTWYDMRSPGARDWVLIANPPGADDIYYEIKIGGAVVRTGGPIKAGKNVTPTFPGIIGGPVEVRTFSDPSDPGGTPANSIASQRVIWGPSFEEVPGQADFSLGSNYHWTWYDQASPGSRNWVLIANPTGSAESIFYEIRKGGVAVRNGGPIAPGRNVTPTFPGTIGGPVEVRTFTDPLNPGGTPANSISSQRVLWSGFFNEVGGLVLK